MVNRPAVSPAKLPTVVTARVEVEKVHLSNCLFFDYHQHNHSYHHHMQAADFSDCCIICVGSTGAGKSSTVGRNHPNYSSKFNHPN